ncbi:MAG: FTR1 family iron permease [Planctomycetota bacterium]|nr:FTR1 family iron permease [Planctomycetota bacterium]
MNPTPRLTAALALAWVVLTSPAVPAGQAKPSPASWNEVAAEMIRLLDRSYESYFIKEVDRAKKEVNDAYFGYYEKLGFERTVLSYISGRRAAVVEYQFSTIKQHMTERAANSVVRKDLDLLIKMLREDANQLDGREESGLGVFIASLLILVREGFEAILVIAAIAAYLVRSGNAGRVGVVYWSAGGAVLASIVLAIVLQTIFEISGANQEILEGAAMLLATVVLFFVSNWMLAKAEAEAWKKYIDDKVKSAVASGSAFALGLAAFLAVFREGAETILFYQALVAETKENMNMVWLGIAVATVILAVIFVLIRYGSLKIPLRPFFIGTSILLFVMAIAFAGGGVKELQEADVIGVTPVAGIESIDLLGIHPTVETLAPQVVLVLLAVLGSLWSVLRARKAAKA